MLHSNTGAAYARAFDLVKHIQFDTEVEKIEFVPITQEEKPDLGTQGCPNWNIVAQDIVTGTVKSHLNIDTLILANGRHNLPHFPSATLPSTDATRGNPSQLPGLNQWLEADRAEHAMYYRMPNKKYRGRTILVVGDGPSARDIAPEIATVAKTVWRSIRKPTIPKAETGGLSDSTSADQQKKDPLPIRFCGPVTSLGTPKAMYSDEDAVNVFFADGSSLSIDYIIFATGYELSFPFLPATILEEHRLEQEDIFDTVQTENNNTKNSPLSLYPLSLSPLLHHLLPFSLRLPLGSLFALGLPRPVVPFPLVQVQCHLLTAALQGRGQLHRLRQEMEAGVDQGPFYGGNADPGSCPDELELSRRYHLFPFPSDQFDYRESLTRLSLSTIDEGEIQFELERMVPVWQREVYDKKEALRAIWRDLESRGLAHDTVRDVGNGADAEKEWVGLMEKLLQTAA